MHSQVMGFHSALALLFMLAFAILLQCNLGWSSMCSRIVSYAAASVQNGVRRLFGAFIALLCLRWSFRLRFPSGINHNSLFPLGVILGFSVGSVLNRLCLLGCADFFAMVLLASGSVIFESFLFGDCVHLSTLSVPPVVMKDAGVQVQFVPALPQLFQPLCVSPALRPILPPALCASVVMPISGPSTYPSPVAPVLSAAVRSYFPVVFLVHYVLPFLDSFEILYTTRSMYAYRSHTPRILAWHEAYIRTQCSGFVPDPARRVVRTSAGTMVYPDVGTVMRPSFLTVIPESITSSRSPAMASVYRDVDSLVCTFCGKRRHEAVNCHKKQKRDKQLAKRSSLGASAANKWGWGFC